MEIKLPLFYIFSFLAVVSAAFVVTAKNPVRAVLSLVATFFCMAANWMLLESEYLSLLLILVYVGAVMVLFLFVVMMIHLETLMTQRMVRYWPVGIVIAAAFVSILILAVHPKFFVGEYGQFNSHPADFAHVATLGELIFTDYLLAFEIAGVILFIAMVSAIGLTFRGRRQAKTQVQSKQVQVKKSDRLKIIKMPSGGDK